MKTSSKNKIFLLAGVYVAGCLTLFLYGFKLLDAGNAATAQALIDQRKQLNDLQTEQRNFQLGNQDLETLEQKPNHPDNFFSKDVRVVNEIKILEALGRDTKVNFTLAVSGTVQSGGKTPGVNSDILSIPYSLTLSGPFANVAAFLEQMENLSFVTQAKTIAISSSGKGPVNASVSATFFITK